MNKKIATIFLLSLFLAVILSDAVSAAKVPTDVFDWFSESQTWPPYPPGSTDEFPRWYIGLVWVALGSAVLITASRTALFKETSHKNAVIALAIAFSGVAVAGTGFVPGVASIFGVGTGALIFVGFIALVCLIIGLLSGSLGLTAKIGGESLKLGGQGVEAAREAVRDIKGEGSNEQRQQGMLSNLEQLEQGGLRDVNSIISYVQEILRVLSDANSLRDRRLREVLAGRINSFNVSVRALRLDTLNIERVTRAMERISMQEISLLRRDMSATRTASTNVAIRSIADGQINNYLNNLRTTFVTDYRNETNMVDVEARLNAAEAALRGRLNAGVRSLNANDIPRARTGFDGALNQLQIIGTDLAELQRIETGIEQRIQRETRGTNALAHLQRI